MLVGTSGLDPHEVSQDIANWTTQLLAIYLTEKTGISVSLETVRVYRHAHGYGGSRPTWTRHSQSRREHRLRGKREARWRFC